MIMQIEEKIIQIRGEKMVFLFIFFVFCSLSFALAQEDRYGFSSADRDPFSPLISKRGTILIAHKIDVGGLNIKGIIYSEVSSVAIINNEVVKEGDKIGEYLVLEIEEKRVTLIKGDEKLILILEGEE